MNRFQNEIVVGEVTEKVQKVKMNICQGKIWST